VRGCTALVPGRLPVHAIGATSAAGCRQVIDFYWVENWQVYC
jgi:hypothetical protein